MEVVRDTMSFSGKFVNIVSNMDFSLLDTLKLSKKYVGIVLIYPKAAIMDYKSGQLLIKWT